MQPIIRLTARDESRLQSLLQQADTAARAVVERLEGELLRARRISVREAKNVVQLDSQVTWESLDTGTRRTAILRLAQHVSDPRTELSVLTPAGCALIGLREGDVFAWEEGPRQWRIRVLSVVAPETR